MEVAPLRWEVAERLRNVMDPELGLNIVSLGMLYDVQVHPDGAVVVTMTLTTPGCPLHAIIGKSIERVLLQLPGISDVKVDLVFAPPWDPRMMDEAARAELGQI